MSGATRPEASRRWPVGLLRAGALLGGATAVGGLLTMVLTGHGGLVWSSEALSLSVAAIFLGTLTWVLAPTQPGNAAVWVMGAAAVLTSVYVASSAAAVLAVAGDPALVAGVLDTPIIPADLPPAAAWLRLVGDGAGSAGFMLWATLGLLLFPDGKLPSRGWRWVARLAGASLIAMSIGWAWSSRPWNTSPNDGGLLFNAALLVLMPLALLAAGSLVVRLRRSTGVARQQFKWIAWGASFLVVGVAAAIIVSGTGYRGIGIGLLAFGEAIAMASYGIAIGRYRLLDIDLVISRTVLYGVMAVLITAVYVVVAVGLGGLLGGSSLWLSVVATAVVSVAFEPVRRRVQRWANRLVYGTRATPYEVLSEVAGRLATAESEEGLIGRMATMLAAGTGATRAGVWVVGPAGLSTAAVAPEGLGLAAATLDELPGAVTPIEYGGEVLGALTVEKARGDAVTATERGLVEDLAASAGMMMRKLRLDAALEAKAAQLRESRRRLVDAQDAERRRLERALDDGAQQMVVGLKVRLGLARQVGEEEGLDRAVGLIGQMIEESQVALDQIRLLARGVYPPLLQAEGLALAVPAVGDSSPLEARCAVDVPHRYPLSLEGAVYFCVSEALTNAAKHARGPLEVRVTGDDETLSFSVADAGPGFDPAQTPHGSGLRNMADRLESLGGALTITSTPGGVTTVLGRVPVPVAAPV